MISMLRGKLIIGVLVVVLLIGVIILVNQTEAPAPVIGLYDEEGTWSTGKVAFRNFFEQEEIDWVLLSAEDINEASDLSSMVDLLWVPGGWAWPYTQDINSAGVENIREFVGSGGRFIGTCAGQFYAADSIVWEGEEIRYPLNLFDGVIKGAIDEIVPWDGYDNTEIILNKKHPINAGFPEVLTMAYYGGGELYPEEDDNFFVVAYYDVTGTKAIGTLKYGDGYVLLIGPHPEMGLTPHGTWNATGDYTAQWEWLSSAVKWLLEQE